MSSRRSARCRAYARFYPHEILKSHESYEATRRPVFARHVYFQLHFPDQSVRGLNVGAPVEFRGILVGQVTDVRLEYDAANKTLRIPVVIEVEPERVQALNVQGGGGQGLMAKLVQDGLRAQLKSGNLLTGQLYVSLDMHRDAPPAELVQSKPYPELPTVPTPLEEITASLTRVVQHLEKMPLDQIGAELRDTFRQLNRDVLPNLRGTLTQATGTLASVGPDSSVNSELRRTLNDLSEAARALELTADELERQPQSLIFGKGGHD